MIMTIRSAVLLTLLEYVLFKGVDFLEKYSAEKEEELRAWVYKIIPGDDFDAVVWSVIKPFIPKLFDVARKLIDKIDGKTDRPELAFCKIEAIKEIVS
jgi:hypothetical protein